MKNVDIISKVVARKGEAMASPSKGAAPSVDLSGYLLKEIWDRIFEIRTTENGEEYIFCKTSLAAQGGLTMYVDGGLLNLPSIYDGLPIDGKTLFWEEVIADNGTKSKVLKSKGGGGGSIEYPLSWSGFSSGSYDGTEAKTIYIPSKVSELTNDSNYAKTSDLSKYLPLTGGTITGNLTLCASNSTLGTTLYFGDEGYVYLEEDSEDHLNIYADGGISLSCGSSYGVVVKRKLQVLGNLIADGDYAFMPMDSGNNGMYFHGLNLSLHKNHSYVEPIFSINGSQENRVVFAKTPMVSEVGYLATQSWVGERYLLLSGGAIKGTLSVEDATTPLKIRNIKSSSGGAYVMYYPCNQASNGWISGAGGDLSYYIQHTTDGGNSYKALLNLSTTGGLKLYSQDADGLKVLRANTNGGAFISYLGMNQTSQGWGAGTSGSHDFVWMYFTDGSLANGAIHMTLDKSANLLIKGLLTFQGTSDKRLKQNIRTFSASEELMKLGGVYQFEYVEEEVKRNYKYKGTHFGLIYQNVKESSLSKMCMEREDGYGALNYLDTSFISLLAAVGMEHETRLQRLERENRELRMEVEQLKNK